MRGTSTAARIAAPLAFLLAATVFVLLVRAALDPAEQTAATGTETVETEPAPAPEEPEPEPPPPPRTQPAPTQPAQTQPPPTQPTQTQPTQTQTEPATYHEIQSGDTLEAIAAQYGTTVERLLELNPGVDPVALTVGERVRVS